MPHQMTHALLAEVESRLRDLDRDRALAACDRFTGGGPADLAELDRRELAAVSDPAYRAALAGEADRAAPAAAPPTAEPSQAARLARHRLRAAEISLRADPEFSTRTGPLEERILSYRAGLDGRPANPIDIRDALGREPDRSRREELWFAAAPLAESIAPDVAALFEARNRRARELGYGDFPHLAAEATGFALIDFLALGDELEQLTRPAYEEFLAWCRQEAAIETLEPWDLDHRLHSIAPPAEVFPATSFAGRRAALLSDWGLESAPKIRIREADIPWSGLCLPVSVPDDIRLLVNPRDGMPHLEEHLHHFGHALRLAHFPAEEVALHWDGGPWPEASARLFALAGTRLERREIRRRESGAAWDRWRSVWVLRRRLAEALFEVFAYERPGGDLHSLHCELEEHYLGFPRHPEKLWAARGALVSRPFHAVSHLIGRLAAEQIGTTLMARFGGEPEGPDVGRFLVEEVWRPEGPLSWEERLQALTGKPLDAEAWLEGTGAAVRP